MSDPASNGVPPAAAPDFSDYVSAGGKRGLLLPTFGFYQRVVRIVLRASRQARRGRYGDREFWDSSLQVRSAFERAGADVRVSGTAHLAQLDGPAVIIGNHMSTAETFLLPGILMPIRPITFVVKQALLDYPVFRHVMRSRNPIVVGRVNPRDDLKTVMEGGLEHLDAGRSVVIFPQRTRTVRFDPEAFNTIGVKLARRAAVPVVPLALRTDAWSNGRLVKDFGRFYPDRPVRFAFGEPIAPGTPDRDAHQQVISFIQARLQEFGLGDT